MRVEEIGVLGDDDGTLVVGRIGDIPIRGLVPVGEVKGVGCDVAEFGQADGQQAGQLGTSCGRQGFEALDSGEAGGVGVSGFQVIGLKVRVVGEDVGFGGFAAKELKQEFDGIAEPADAGFTMADIRGEGDAFEKIFCGHEESVAWIGGKPRWEAG